MDKWDKLKSDLIDAVVTNNDAAGMSATLSIVVEFGRTLELIAESLDQLATKER